MGTWIPLLIEKEELLLEKRVNQGTKLPVIVAMGGLSGTGKDTLGNEILHRINSFLGIQLRKYNAGDFMRELAVNEGFPPEDLDEFVNKIKNDPIFSKKVDLFIEERTLAKAIEEGGVFTGRMAPFTIGDHGLTIFLEADPQIIANRLITDDKRPEYGCSVEQVVKKTLKRDKADKERLKRLYDVNFDELLERVELVLDTSQFTVEESVDNIFKAFQKKYVES
ncbi:MAG: cytidylate kinase-like family protein [Candidatus Hodarchaeales archaeon]|jgi:cytidylate kinase